MNIIVFWILFLVLWGTVPIMIWKGRDDEKLKPQPITEIKTKKKGWFN